MESHPQNPEFRNNPENFHPYTCMNHHCMLVQYLPLWVAQWLSGRVLDSRTKGRGFQAHWHHCVVVLEQNTFILA